MKSAQLPLSGLLAVLSASFLSLEAHGQHGDPYEPVGDLTVSPTVVQTGVQPEMFWDIEYPEVVGDLVDVGDNSQVYTNKDLQVKVRVVGVAFQSGNTPLPAALWMRARGGPWELLFYGRHHDVNPAEFVYDQEVSANTRIDFAARGKNSSGRWYTTRWTVNYMEEVIGLQNGQEVPAYAPAYNQGDIEDFLTQFIADTDGDDNMNVVLGPRDMIYLFELASTNPGDWWFDMQDLVTVVTFDEPENPDDQGDSSAAEYANFIRQIQQDSGVEWDVTVDPDGNQLSPEGVSAEGSFFQLWSIHTDTAAEFLLDEQFVTSYTPNASIVIETGDPYESVPRTRVDQPFTVNFEVNGLLAPGAGVPLAAQQVAITHQTFNYPDGQHALDGDEDLEGTIVQQGFLGENGSSTIGFAVTNLQAADLTSAEGEEVFTVSALADFSVSAAVLDSQRIQIWPIATGAFSGFDTSEEYLEIPPVNVRLSDLYPASATYVRVYPGPARNEPDDAKIVTASYVLINDSIPQDRVLSLDNLHEYFTEDGEYVLEILHETPFGTDLLSRSTMNVDHTVSVTGSLFTRE